MNLPLTRAAAVRAERCSRIAGSLRPDLLHWVLVSARLWSAVDPDSNPLLPLTVDIAGRRARGLLGRGKECR